MDSTANRAGLFEVRSVDLHDPFAWLREGWQDLRAAPLPSLFYGLCFAIMGYVLAYVLRHQPQHLAAATAGFLLLGPALAIGLYDLSRQRSLGKQPQWKPSLTAWRRNLANIGLFSLVLLVIFLVWARVSLLTFALFFTGDLPTVIDLARHITSPDNAFFLTAWIGIGALFAALVFVVSVVSVPMLLDRQTDAVTAALTSLRVVALNAGAMAIWAAIIAWATSAALLMGFVGIVIVGPLLGHGSWHAYRATVGNPRE